MDAPPPFDEVVSSSRSELITLAWMPASGLFDDRLASRSGSSSTAMLDTEPIENPPEYETARRPANPVLYSFSPVSANAMLLIPPSDAPDTRPVYHISVSLNCFNPLSAITCIRRGATEYGEYVGDFELGISSKPGTVCFRNKELAINSVLTKMGSREGCLWVWMSKSPKHTVTWDTRLKPAVCHVGLPTSPPVAKFYLAEGNRRPSAPASVSKLEIMPHGHERFDDILISLLITERKRLMPGGVDHKVLFS